MAREEKWRRWESNPRPLECHWEVGVYGRCATVRDRARNQALASTQAARRARSRTVRPAQYPHTRLSLFARCDRQSRLLAERSAKTRVKAVAIPGPPGAVLGVQCRRSAADA